MKKGFRILLFTNGSIFPSTRKYVEDSNFGHAVALVITELTKEDRGKYSCSAPFDGNKTLHQTIEIDFYGEARNSLANRTFIKGLR